MGNDRDILIAAIDALIPEELENDEAIVFTYKKRSNVKISHVGGGVEAAMAVIAACETVLKKVGMKKEAALEALAVAWDAEKEEIEEGK